MGRSLQRLSEVIPSWNLNGRSSAGLWIRFKKSTSVSEGHNNDFCIVAKIPHGVIWSQSQLDSRKELLCDICKREEVCILKWLGSTSNARFYFALTVFKSCTSLTIAYFGVVKTTHWLLENLQAEIIMHSKQSVLLWT